jgi:hypothetical protein
MLATYNHDVGKKSAGDKGNGNMAAADKSKSKVGATKRGLVGEKPTPNPVSPSRRSKRLRSHDIDLPSPQDRNVSATEGKLTSQSGKF